MATAVRDKEREVLAGSGGVAAGSGGSSGVVVGSGGNGGIVMASSSGVVVASSSGVVVASSSGVVVASSGGVGGGAVQRWHCRGWQRSGGVEGGGAAAMR